MLSSQSQQTLAVLVPQQSMFAVLVQCSVEGNRKGTKILGVSAIMRRQP